MPSFGDKQIPAFLSLPPVTASLPQDVEVLLLLTPHSFQTMKLSVFFFFLLCVRFPNLQYWNSRVPGESLESS